jgi:hypothetical protein
MAFARLVLDPLQPNAGRQARLKAEAKRKL